MTTEHSAECYIPTENMLSTDSSHTESSQDSSNCSESQCDEHNYAQRQSTSRMDSLENFMSSQFSHIIKEIGLLSNNIQTVNTQLHDKLEKVENNFLVLNSRVSEIENPDSEVRFNHGNRTSQENSNVQIANNSTQANRNSNYTLQISDHAPVNVSHDKKQTLRMKPQNYSGSEDLQDFLTQFDITAEINGWNYTEKSLYLASTLTGSARSLLSELNDTDRRDFSCLVTKLKNRFSSENRAEVYRTQLKCRLRAKGETIPELAQSIRKMTRQAYPTASSDVVETLALDCFIDAINESEIRLRLREICPKNVSEAEQVAVRMEAQRIADRQRNKLIGNVNETSAVGNACAHNQTPPNTNHYHRNNQNSTYNHSNFQTNRNNRHNNQSSWNTNRNRFTYNRSQPLQARADNPRVGSNRGPQSSRTHNENGRTQNENRQRVWESQGNGQMSSWRDHSSTRLQGPRLH